jgi:hypothetical protein
LTPIADPQRCFIMARSIGRCATWLGVLERPQKTSDV